MNPTHTKPGRNDRPSARAPEAEELRHVLALIEGAWPAVFKVEADLSSRCSTTVPLDVYFGVMPYLRLADLRNVKLALGAALSMLRRCVVAEDGETIQACEEGEVTA